MISTGLQKLDTCLGGGLKEGMITDIFGQNATGKSQLAFQICINALKAEKKCYSKIQQVDSDQKD